MTHSSSSQLRVRAADICLPGQSNQSPSTAFSRFESYRRITQPRPEERARARLEGRPHSARSLGPCPWQASQQGCRLGRAREHDRHAALSRRTARPVIESPATPEAPAGSAHAGPAPVCPSDRRSQPAHTASPPSDLHLGRAVGKGPGRGGGDAVPHTRPGFCVLPLDGFAEREQSSPRPPLRGRRRRLVESPVGAAPQPPGLFRFTAG